MTFTPMTVTFWGVRGAVPAPGATTVRYGGNTTCISLTSSDNRTLIFDAGTGIRALGKVLQNKQTDIYILVTHSHWDHIQGFPFFTPIYEPERVIYILPALGRTMACTLLEQMDGARFPVKAEELLSENQFVQENPMQFLAEHGFGASRILLNHPGGGYGYRINHEGRSFVLLTDNELYPPGEPTTSYDEFVEFCRGADVLVHDAQYLPEDMPAKRGWGHSLVHEACELAQDAMVKHLVLFHHDPDRTDDELLAIQKDANLFCKRCVPEILCSVAYEGMVLTV